MYSICLMSVLLIQCIEFWMLLLWFMVDYRCWCWLFFEIFFFLDVPVVCILPVVRVNFDIVVTDYLLFLQADAECARELSMDNRSDIEDQIDVRELSMDNSSDIEDPVVVNQRRSRNWWHDHMDIPEFREQQRERSAVCICVSSV